MKSLRLHIILIAFFCSPFFISALRAQVISPEHNYAQNSPGIVMVQSVFSATVYVNKVEMNERAFDKLVDSVKRLDTTGKILSPGLRLDIVVNALNRTPLRYFSAGRQYFRQVHRVQSAGTGFLVSGDGYIVTNCHIIDRDSAFIRSKFILETYQEVTEANINALQSSWAMKLSDQQRSLLYNAYGLIYSQVSSMILFDLKKEIYVLYRGDSTLDNNVIIKKKANVVLKGSPMPGKDVAILKIDDVKELPALPVSNDLAIQIGTQVLVFGYPEPVTSNTFLDTESGMEPSLTTGIISAVKKSVGGWPVIQMDALISHGSSGSPVCNDKGEVIGLATFGSFDPGSTGLASGFNFAIPVSVLKEFLDSVQLKTELSHASKYFNQGLDLFFNQFYSRAKDKFERVKKLNEKYPQLTFYIDQCNNKIARGVDKQSPPRKYVLWIMLVIALMTGFYLLFLRKKMRSS